MNENSLKQKILEKTKTAFLVWQNTVQEAHKNLPDRFNARELSDEIDKIRMKKDWIHKDNVEEAIEEAIKQIRDKRDKVTVWVKNNLIDREDFVDDDDFNGYALELSNAIQVFINRQVLTVLEGEK